MRGTVPIFIPPLVKMRRNKTNNCVRVQEKEKFSGKILRTRSDMHLFFEMFVKSLSKLHHVNRAFLDDFRKLCIGNDPPLVLRILEVVRFNILPDFFCHFRTRKLWSFDNCLKLFRKVVGWLSVFRFFLGFLASF